MKFINESNQRYFTKAYAYCRNADSPTILTFLNRYGVWAVQSTIINPSVTRFDIGVQSDIYNSMAVAINLEGIRCVLSRELIDDSINITVGGNLLQQATFTFTFPANCALLSPFQSAIDGNVSTYGSIGSVAAAMGTPYIILFDMGVIKNFAIFSMAVDILAHNNNQQTIIVTEISLDTVTWTQIDSTTLFATPANAVATASISKTGGTARYIRITGNMTHTTGGNVIQENRFYEISVQ